MKRFVLQRIIQTSRSWGREFPNRRSTGKTVLPFSTIQVNPKQEIKKNISEEEKRQIEIKQEPKEEGKEEKMDHTLEVIEKYKELIQSKKKKSKMEDKQIINTGKDQAIHKKELSEVENKETENEIKEAQSKVINEKNKDQTNKSIMQMKDEKFVILKKQITKEFVHQVFLPHVESQIIHHLKTYTPDQIVNLFHIYSYLYFFDKKKEMIEQLIDYVEYRLDCFSVQNILMVLEPLYILNKLNNMYIYRLIINRIDELKEKMNIYNYIGISRVFTKILIDIYFEENRKEKSLLSDIFQNIKYRKFIKKIPQEQKKISHKNFIIDFMSNVMEVVGSQLQLLTAIELTDLLSIIANYSFKNEYSKYKMNIPVDNSKDSNHIQSLIQVHELSPNNMYTCKENIIAFLIIEEIKKKYNELTTLHKIVNLYNLTKLCIYDEKYIQLIDTDLNNYYYLTNIHHKYLSLLIWCFFKLKKLDKYRIKLLPLVQENVDKFNGKELARLCHSICNETQILNTIAFNLIKRIEDMSINEFLCYLYSVVLLDLLPHDASITTVSYKNEKKKKVL